MGYRYSVIVPIYNAEKTIRRCLDSLIAQNSEHPEIILVDDGSSDNSNLICREYACAHVYIRLITQKNQGVSCARNAGLDASSGEYVMFVDSDDFVYGNLFSTLDDMLDRRPADLVFFGAVNRSSYEDLYLDDPCAIAEKCNDWEHRGMLASPWAKVFRRELIEQLCLRFHTSLSIGEDLVFVYAFLLHCNSVITISENLYHVVLDNPDSLSRRRRDYLQDQALLMRRQMLKDLKDANLPAREHRLFYRPLSWGFYHGVYSVCIELQKFEYTDTQRCRMIRQICRTFCRERIIPGDLKTWLLALPIRFRLAFVLNTVIKFKYNRQSSRR